MARGTRRSVREAVLDDLEASDPARAAELRSLRATNPQAFRKAVARLEGDLATREHRPPRVARPARRSSPAPEPVLAREVELRRAAGEAANRMPRGLVGFTGPGPAGNAVESVQTTTHDDVEAAATADLRVLNGTLADIKAALATGALDRHLDALMDAELAAKARKGVLAAIRAQKEAQQGARKDGR